MNGLRSMRTAIALAGLTLAGILGGCTKSNSVAFTNVSDSWLNVRVFAGSSLEPGQKPSHMTSDKKLQIRPGDTMNYRLTAHPGYNRNAENLVHVQVQPVSPSWEPVGADYWLELLTPPPVTIVATGSSRNLTFMTGDGAVAVIPDYTIQENRFKHQITLVPESSASPE